MEVILQRTALAQELRAEQDVLVTGLLPDAFGVANRDGGTDHDRSMAVHSQDLFNGLLHRRDVKAVQRAVVVGGRCHYHKVGLPVGSGGIQRGGEVQRLFGQIPADAFVLQRGLAMVEKLHFFRYDVHSKHFVMLRQKHRHGKADIAGAGNGNGAGSHGHRAPFR